MKSDQTQSGGGLPARSGEKAVAGGSGASGRKVIFFDGVCNLCNEWVDFVMRRDRAGLFYFAPLQGETAREKLSGEMVSGLSSIVMLEEEVTSDGQNRVLARSSAVACILVHLPGMWMALGLLLWAIPRPIRDVGYDFIAERRYRIFGKRDTCRLPTPEERARFLP